METIFLFFSTYFFTLPFLIGLFIFGVILERSESFFGLVIVALMFYCVYGYFSLTIQQALIYSALYIPIGLVWSIYRYKRWVDKSVQKIREYFIQENEKIKKSNKKDDDVNSSIEFNEIKKKERLSELEPQKNLSRISAWVFVWPFSIVENLSSDIVDSIQAIIKSMFRSVYNKIYQSAISKAD